MKDQINTIRAGLAIAIDAEGFVDKPVRRALLDALTALSDLESHLAQYEAGDMASAAAQGFRDGVASVAQQPQADTPQATTIAEAARDVGKWLNERPNRPIDLRHVAMLVAHAMQPQAEAVIDKCSECGKTSTKESMWALYCVECIESKIAPALAADQPPAATVQQQAEVVPDEVRRVLNRLDSFDPGFDDCADAAALIIKMAHELKGPDGFATWKEAAIAERMRRLETAPQQAEAVPRTHVLVPKRMTRAMERVTEEEGWAWADLLAAAESITEAEYGEIQMDDATPQQAEAVPPDVVRDAAPIPDHELVTMYDERPTSDLEMIEFAREVERRHGIGVQPQHITDGSPCWCNPDVAYTDPETGASVILHRRPQ